MTGVTRAASPGPTLHPEDVVPRGGPCGVTGRAFVETAVTDLGLCQMQGARREQAIPGGARGPGETPTYPHPTGKTSRPNSNQPPPPGSLPGLKQCSPPTLRPSPLPRTSRPRPAPPLMHSLAIPPPCLELRGGVRVHVEVLPQLLGRSCQPRGPLPLRTRAGQAASRHPALCSAPRRRLWRPPSLPSPVQPTLLKPPGPIPQGSRTHSQAPAAGLDPRGPQQT